MSAINGKLSFFVPGEFKKRRRKTISVAPSFHYFVTRVGEWKLKLQTTDCFRIYFLFIFIPGRSSPVSLIGSVPK